MIFILLLSIIKITNRKVKLPPPPPPPTPLPPPTPPPTPLPPPTPPVPNNSKQNCTLTQNGTDKHSCENDTDNQCEFKLISNGLKNPSFNNYYYPWCYFKKDSYMLWSQNRTENCGLPCSSNCKEIQYGVFNKNGKINLNKSRVNTYNGNNTNFNWCFKKKSRLPFNTPNIEICTVPNTDIGTYPNCSDCNISAGGGGSCTDILMTPDNNNLNNIGFKHYPLIQIGKDGFDKNFLTVNTKPITYSWPGEKNNKF